MLAQFDLSGELDHANLKRIDRATLSVEVGDERAFAQLREPIVDPFSSAWPIQCSWRGNLAPWTPRLARCLGMTGWDLRGAGTLQVVAVCSRNTIEVEHAQADFVQLQVWGHEWFINEPSASLSVEGRYDLEKTRVQVDVAKLTAGSTSAVVRKAVL